MVRTLFVVVLMVSRSCRWCVDLGNWLKSGKVVSDGGFVGDSRFGSDVVGNMQFNLALALALMILFYMVFHKHLNFSLGVDLSGFVGG